MSKSFFFCVLIIGIINYALSADQDKKNTYLNADSLKEEDIHKFNEQTIPIIETLEEFCNKYALPESSVYQKQLESDDSKICEKFGLVKSKNVQLSPAGLTPKLPEKRTRFTECQRKVLGEEFQKKQYGNSERYCEIAGRIGLTSTQVSTWFNNERCKMRKRAQRNGQYWQYWQYLRYLYFWQYWPNCRYFWQTLHR